VGDGEVEQKRPEYNQSDKTENDQFDFNSVNGNSFRRDQIAAKEKYYKTA
jgi:hypothetical protein